MPNFTFALPPSACALQRVQRRVSRLAIGFGLVLTSLLTLPQTSPALANPVLSQNLGNALADGIYLFGRSPQPEQIGSEYLVFEVRNQHTVGAFYMPSSSFDCFQGEVQPDRLLLTVVGSYDQSASDYAIALQPGSDLSASEQGVTAAPSLENYYEIDELSQMDHSLLETCQQVLPQRQAI
ncbi:MAG: hypothetical protein ACTS3T_18750 [Almyronema sp.]